MLSVMRCRTASVHGHGRLAIGVRGNVRDHILITTLVNTRQMPRAMFRLGEFNSVSKGGKGPLRSDRSLLSRSLGWLIGGIWVVCQIVLIAWGTLAIYYSNLPGLRRA